MYVNPFAPNDFGHGWIRRCVFIGLFVERLTYIWCLTESGSSWECPRKEWGPWQHPHVKPAAEETAYPPPHSPSTTLCHRRRLPHVAGKSRKQREIMRKQKEREVTKQKGWNDLLFLIKRDEPKDKLVLKGKKQVLEVWPKLELIEDGETRVEQRLYKFWIFLISCGKKQSTEPIRLI